MSTALELKTQGNDMFVQGKYSEAVSLYTQAILDYEPTAVLYTNRAAAKISLMQLEEAREDASAAIGLDASFTKAYYRKATTEEKLGLEKAAYDTWTQCYKKCEHNKWLNSQIKASKARWNLVYKKIKVENDEDFIERYGISPDSRERLSTMAHFWNISTHDDRLNHFQYFLQLVGGNSDVSEKYLYMKADMMPDMPMHNYVDLPIENIVAWRDYFLSLSGSEKTNLLKMMYISLNSTDQGMVIQDLGIFINAAYEQSLAAAKSKNKQGTKEPLPSKGTPFPVNKGKLLTNEANTEHSASDSDGNNCNSSSSASVNRDAEIANVSNDDSATASGDSNSNGE